MGTLVFPFAAPGILGIASRAPQIRCGGGSISGTCGFGFWSKAEKGGLDIQANPHAVDFPYVIMAKPLACFSQTSIGGPA